MNHASHRGLALALLGTLSVGCAARQALPIASSASAIRAAEEHGAASLPSASLYLQLAKEELAEAEALQESKEDEQAASLLLRAEADAELAVALAKADKDAQAAAAALDRIQKLRTDNPYAAESAQ